MFWRTSKTLPMPSSRAVAGIRCISPPRAGVAPLGDVSILRHRRHVSSVTFPDRTHSYTEQEGRGLDLGEIRARFSEGVYEMSMHAQQERLEEDVDIVEVEAAISTGVILRTIRTTHAGRVA